MSAAYPNVPPLLADMLKDHPELLARADAIEAAKKKQPTASERVTREIASMSPAQRAEMRARLFGDEGKKGVAIEHTPPAAPKVEIDED
ncbi:hypothetical protein [Paraburkholderia sp. C35]|uniref:hypothetical protein n=1 Tax=Paraburkholderia sp. C35 TaxID=2126993 RepID=UPI000D6872DF|nr:hypothetical protein [Paraburkholderia sp. C35]